MYQILVSAEQRTYYCQNLKSISECVNIGVGDLSCNNVKKGMRYKKVPDDQKWKPALLKDLLEVRWNNMEIDVLDNDLEHIEEVIEAICVS